MVTPQTARFDLLQLPVIGGFLRWRYGRMALQSVAFVLAVLVIADGFLGHSMGAMNLAGILPWTYVRAFGVIALLIVGNIFCMSCPFMLPRELGHRLGFAKLKWPRWLRSKWIAIALMILFFWAYEAFDLWDHPQRTAWLLIAYFAAAFVVDTFFRGASFCKYVCPLGQFNFAGSLLSPFTLEARSEATCDRCTTHDCIRGNQQQRGCELQLYMPQKAGNMDCTLCMDCVKACPHDNIGLFAVAPVRDVLRDPVRSSIGRFSARTDIAALVLVVVVAAFVNAAVDGGSDGFGKIPGTGGRFSGGGNGPAGGSQPIKKRTLLPLLPGAAAFGAGHVGCPSVVSSVHRLGNAAARSPSGRNRLWRASADAGSMGKRAAAAARQYNALGTAFAAGCRLAPHAVPGVETGAAMVGERRPGCSAAFALGKRGHSRLCGRCVGLAPTYADARRHNESMKGFGPLAAALMLGMWATAAHGDGGTMLLHQDAGAFTITLFAAPQPLHAGEADLSVLVQDRSSGEVLLDPVVDLSVGSQAPVRLTRGQASNRLLQAAAVRFANPGKWRLTLVVRRGGDLATLSTECTVEPDRSRATMVWFYVLLPVGIILLFVIHQVLKLRSEVQAK